jgi:4-carboxymuconolactone decarboxylase
MIRIEPISSQSAGPFMRFVLWVAQRKVGALVGRSAEGMIEPAEAYAHTPGLLLGCGALEQATVRLHGVEERLKVLAELKAATLTHCEWCIDIGSHIARRAGVSDAQMLALAHYRESDLFDESEKLVIDYAVGMSSTPVAVSDELFSKLRARFDDAQIVELTSVIALENMRGRFNLALGIGAAGVSDGMVCAVPATEVPDPEAMVPAVAARKAPPVPETEVVPAT